MADEKADDQRSLFIVVPHTSGFILMTPYMAIGGFETPEAAFNWLRGYFDDNARRNAEFDQQKEYDAARLRLEREEMLARLLEPKQKQ